MLALEELLIETDPDLSRVATIITGFDDNGNLVFEFEITNYDYPSESFKKNIVIDKHEAYTLAKKANTSLIKLPAYIAKRYCIQPFCQSLLPSKATSLFSDILYYLATSRVKYKIHRS